MSDEINSQSWVGIEGVKQIIQNVQNTVSELYESVKACEDEGIGKTQTLEYLQLIAKEVKNGILTLNGDLEDSYLGDTSSDSSRKNPQVPNSDQETTIRELKAQLKVMREDYEQMIKKKDGEIYALNIRVQSGTLEGENLNQDYDETAQDFKSQGTEEVESESPKNSKKKVKFRHAKNHTKSSSTKKLVPLKNRSSSKKPTNKKYEVPFYKNHPHSIYHQNCTPVTRRSASHGKNKVKKRQNQKIKNYQKIHVDTEWWRPSRSLPKLDPELQSILNALPLLKPYEMVSKTWEFSIINSPVLGPFRDKFKRGYEGQFLKERFHGWGVFIRDQGRFIYEGEFSHGKKNGWGRQIACNGEVLQGQWEQDKFIGKRSEFNFKTMTIE